MFRVEVLSRQPARDGRSGDDGPVYAARGHGMAVGQGQREPRTAPGACLTDCVSLTPALLLVVRRRAPRSRWPARERPVFGHAPPRPTRRRTGQARTSCDAASQEDAEDKKQEGGKSYRAPQRREGTRPEATMAATHSARSMSLASFRAGHALRVDAERAERCGREPAARNPGSGYPIDATARPNLPTARAHAEGVRRRRPSSNPFRALPCAPGIGECSGVGAPVEAVLQGHGAGDLCRSRGSRERCAAGGVEDFGGDVARLGRGQEHIGGGLYLCPEDGGSIRPSRVVA